MYLSGRPLVVAKFNPKFTSLVYLCIFLCTCWYRIMIGTTIYHNIMKTIRCNVATLGRLMAQTQQISQCTSDYIVHIALISQVQKTS